jgi:hypothetical protein
VVAVPARIWVSPTAPSRSSLARAAGSHPLDQRAPALDPAGGGEHTAGALLVEHVAVPGGRALDELVLALRVPRERVRLARVDCHGPEAGRLVVPAQGEAAEDRPGDDDEHEREQAGAAQHPRQPTISP